MRKDNLKTGFMDMFILETLYDTDRYGYEIASVLNERSSSYISVAVSTLYPYLYKMEEKGWISSYRVKSGFKMERVYYHLKEQGRLELEEQRAEYYRKVKNLLPEINFKEYRFLKDIKRSRLFSNCSSLKSVDLSKWDTAKVKERSWMFYYGM